MILIKFMSFLHVTFEKAPKMDHHMQPGYGQENYMYGDPAIGFQGNNDYMFGNAGRPMSPPPGDEEVGPSNANLPSALEEVLAFKEFRAKEVGLQPEEVEQLGQFL